MHVAIINRMFASLFGGGEIYDLNAARYLLSRGHQVTVFTGRNLVGGARHTYLAEHRVQRLTPNLRALAYRLPRGDRRLRELDLRIFCRRVAPAARAACPDVVQVCSVPMAARQLGVESWHPRPATVLIQHGPPAADLLSDYLYYSAVVAVGDAYRQLARLLPAQRLFRVDPGVDTERFAPPDKAAAKRSLGLEGREILLFVGRLVPGKGVDRLLRVTREVARSRPQALCLIVGSGPQFAAIGQAVAGYSLERYVRLLPAMPNEQLPAIYGAADLFVTCSRYELLPITVMEAMACGLPILAARVGGIPHLVEQGTNGCLVAPGDGCERDFARAALHLLETGGGEIGRRNREKAVARFSHRVQGEALLRIYSRLLAGCA